MRPFGTCSSRPRASASPRTRASTPPRRTAPGCTLSAAVTAHLARGRGVDAAVEAAIGFLGRAVASPLDVGRGPGAVDHCVDRR
ncbi:MAG: bifunctional hydroxymethylpyrimidine kinase/phosphomethylpyrimidine kinase [Halanaeroarchaeum sp.]